MKANTKILITLIRYSVKFLKSVEDNQSELTMILE